MSTTAVFSTLKSYDWKWFPIFKCGYQALKTFSTLRHLPTPPLPPSYYSTNPDRKPHSICLSTAISNEFHYLIVITDWSCDKFQSYPHFHLVTPTQSHTSSPPLFPHPPSLYFLHPPSPNSSLSTTILSLWVPSTFYRPLFLPPSTSLYYAHTHTHAHSSPNHYNSFHCSLSLSTKLLYRRSINLLYAPHTR